MTRGTPLPAKLSAGSASLVDTMLLLTTSLRSRGAMVALRLANIVAKDPRSLIPDGELFLSCDSIFFDVSAVHSLAPSHLLSPSCVAHTAIEERETWKISKYAAYAQERHGKIVPIVLDCFGLLGNHALALIDQIVEEGGSPLLGSALPARMSKQLFLDTLSQIWQIGNAKIVKEYQMLSRQVIDSRAR